MLNALKIEQPLSTFFLTKIKAEDLLSISFSEELQYLNDEGRLKGSQRKTDEKRLMEIARYIDSVEMSFPTAIILAANYDKNGEIVKLKEDRWTISEVGEQVFNINIPKSIPLAAIIDGQHRLKAFKFIKREERKKIEIPCSIFFDLPNSYQAYLFATINGNQKKVNKSLALEQFGFNVEDEPKKSWTPEKLAVYFSRHLNLDSDSPLHQHIKVAPIDDDVLFKSRKDRMWSVSTAAIVEGILSLISSKPKRDRVEMGQEPIFGSRHRSMVKDFSDSAPLRSLFVEIEDDKIFKILNDFFKAVNDELFVKQKEDSYLIKTVGIQALFDLLKKVLQTQEVISKINFRKYLSKIKNVDFTDDFFQASGVGRQRIKNLLFYANDFKKEDDLQADDLNTIKRLLSNN